MSTSIRQRNRGSASEREGSADVSGVYGAAGSASAAATCTIEAPGPSAWDERGNMLLLVLLYMVQGIPLGLTTGALPFMLQSKLSYSQMGTFALASYPYSMKLLWSPVVDSLYVARLGRRKSWIIPIQLITAWLMLSYAGRVQELFEAADVGALTLLCFMFVLLMATQDIAVDGWALTLLSPGNMSYASTCQTVGQTTGIFTSFTVFLAVQDTNFCNKYIRANPLLGRVFGSEPSPEGLVTLAGYLRFWGWTFAVVTLLMALFKREQSDTHSLATSYNHLDAPNTHNDSNIDTPRTHKEVSAAGTEGPAQEGKGQPGGSANSNSMLQHALREVSGAYYELWQVAKLPAVWQLTALLLTYRLGILCAEGAASLKLIDKGVAKEALAFLVLFQFPVELISAVVAGRWASRASPYPPFIIGYWLRLATAAALVALTATFPPGASSLAQDAGAFGALAGISLATSFVSYLSFTALGSLFTAVSDPAMGGAYLTLLNTIANMGYILPKTPLFYLMDALTRPACIGFSPMDAASNQPWDVAALHASCPKKLKDAANATSACSVAGGTCVLASDGYYLVSCVSLVLGVVLGIVYLRTLPALIRKPLHMWRAGQAGGNEGAAETSSADKED